MPTPSLRTAARTAGALAVVTATAAAMLTFVMPSAGAMAQPRMTLTEGEVKEVTFPGIVGSNPAGAGQDPTTCNSSTYCDTIPVTFVRPPGFDDSQDYFVQIRLSWDTQKVPNPLAPSGERAANDDLDMFIYNDPIQEDAGPGKNGVVSKSDTGTEPEFAYLVAPEGDYSVVVVNFVGVNTGYTIKLTWVSETITSPFESLAPGATPKRPIGSSTPMPPRPSALPPSDTSDFEWPPLAAPVLDLASIEADQAFDTGFEPSEFGDTLAAPPQVSFRPASVVNPDPPSGIALVLWLLVLPLAAIAFGGTHLSRRNANLPRV